MPVTKVDISFWPIPAYGVGIPLEICIKMIEQILVAMDKALATGVVEYHVGSRGLKRFTLKELMDLLAWWTRQKEIAIWGSGIIARRSVPTDY